MDFNPEWEKQFGPDYSEMLGQEIKLCERWGLTPQQTRNRLLEMLDNLIERMKEQSEKTG